MSVFRLLRRVIPSSEQPVEEDLAGKLFEGSKWNFEFAALILLATGIASLGLIQDSAAVVIGGMLVAPLMMPMIGAGLALAKGDTRLIMTAAKAVALGFLLALLTGFTCGLVARNLVGASVTQELVSRGDISPLDLLVALLSGLAASYAIAKPRLSAVLPGVAIAAALVPPIATVGISISFDEYLNAQRAAVLFGTNLAAIVLGSAGVYWCMGYRDTDQGRIPKWTAFGVVVLVISCLGLTVPLTTYLLGNLAAERERNERAAFTDEFRDSLVTGLASLEGITLVDFRVLEQDGVQTLTVFLAVESGHYGEYEWGLVVQGLEAMYQENTASKRKVSLILLRAEEVSGGPASNGDSNDSEEQPADPAESVP